LPDHGRWQRRDVGARSLDLGDDSAGRRQPRATARSSDVQA
jgi:hypothetical protein